MFTDNKLLGNFTLSGIRPARRGQPRIEVTFNIDVNGIVKVSAKDLDTQQTADITISGSNGLSKSDIDRMIKEAEENKAADEKRKGDAEIINKAQTYVDEINNALQEKGDSMDAAQKEQLTKLRDEASGAIAAKDIEKLREIVGRLEDAASQAYAQQQQRQGGDSGNQGQQQEGQQGPDDVVDADFTDAK